MDDLLVLCYHGISETWPDETAVRPSMLEQQLDALRRRGYRAVTISEALTSPVAGKVLVVTFDDAHRSVLELAAPIMKRLGMPGTVYVPTDYAGSSGPMGWEGYDRWVGTEHEDELRCMDWDELKGLVATGWEVGSHTCSHPRLSQADDALVAAELARSKDTCEEQLGRPCDSLAYPYSDYDEGTVRAVREAGYRSAVTVPTRPTSPMPLEWPRIVVGRDDTMRRVMVRAGARRLGPGALARTALALRRISR